MTLIIAWIMDEGRNIQEAQELTGQNSVPGKLDLAMRLRIDFQASLKPLGQPGRIVAVGRDARRPERAIA
jgi:hypothetical protein